MSNTNCITPSVNTTLFAVVLTGSMANIAHIRDPRFAFVKHDVTNFIEVQGPLDHVLHFASPASPNDYLELPIQTLKVGALGTHRALGLAKAKRAKFLLASKIGRASCRERV